MQANRGYIPTHFTDRDSQGFILWIDQYKSKLVKL
jgi:hypothetical protein